MTEVAVECLIFGRRNSCLRILFDFFRLFHAIASAPVCGQFKNAKTVVSRCGRGAGGAIQGRVRAQYMPEDQIGENEKDRTPPCIVHVGPAKNPS